MTGGTVRQVLSRLRYDLLGLIAVAVVMTVVVDVVDSAALESVSTLIPLLGIVVSIFIGFRNRNAYNRWWEARTLWSGVLVNSRAFHYALVSYQDGTPAMAAVTDRMRRREVRHAFTLAAELRGTPPAPGLEDLTPEDPADCSAAGLLSRQAADIAELTQAGMIDRQARRVLVTINSAQVTTDVGLERIRHQPIPRFYDIFIRGLAWFFAILVCTRVDAGGHDSAAGIVLSVLIMALVIIAEQLGRLLEEPLSADVFGLPLERYCAELAAELTPGSTGPGTVLQLKGK
jgi:putative membrane protein